MFSCYRRYYCSSSYCRFSTAGLTFTYFTDAAGTITLATPNAVVANQEHIISGEQQPAGCSDIQPVVVTINAKPTVLITNPAAVCSPATVDLTAAAVTAGSTPGSNLHLLYRCCRNDYSCHTGSSCNISGTYYIKGTTASGCSDIQPVVVTINA